MSASIVEVVGDGDANAVGNGVDADAVMAISMQSRLAQNDLFEQAP
jgi:hypothetical protein